MRKRFIIVALSLISFSVHATHLHCGQILVEQLESNGHTFKITVEAWTDAGSQVLFGGDQSVLDFGDGLNMSVPEQPNEILEGLPGFVGFASFTVQHTYAGPGKYVVSYREPNRNAGVRNFLNSVATAFYLETMFSLDFGMERYRTPVALHPPIFTHQLNEQFSASLAAVDPNDYALWYQNVVPMSDRNTVVSGFQSPESFSVSPYTGLITWDTKFMGSVVAGEFLFAVKISQFALVNGKTQVVGYMIRDYQVIIEGDEENSVGHVKADRETTEIMVEQDANTSFRIFAEHGTDEDVDFDIRTELPVASYTSEVYDSIHESNFFRVARITFQNSTDVIRDNPFVVSVRTTFAHSGIVVHAADVDFSLFTAGINPFDNLLPPLAITNAEFPLRIGPNPTRRFVDIDAPGGQSFQLSIYNSSGNLVASSLITGTNRVDLNQHPSGLYLFVLQNRGGRRISYKIIRE
jgi:hypothetical protein